MTPNQMIRTFRQMYLFTLGCSSTHAAYSSREARTTIAALDPEEFPVLTAHMQLIAGSVAERDVFRTGLRNLIAAAEGNLTKHHRVNRRREQRADGATSPAR